MPVRLRLQRKGRKKKPFYHIVAADIRAPRDGKFIERVGIYNPLTSPATIELDSDRAMHWLNVGAQPTDTVRAILKFKGVMYKKHLQRGVKKGAMTQEQADELYNAFVAKKEAKVETRKEKTAQEMEERRKRIFGEAPARPEPKVEEEVVVEEAPVAEDAAETTEENTEDNAEA